MAESLKIIHVCDHTVKEYFEELKVSSVRRQETREDEVVSCTDDRLIYDGSWTVVKNGSNMYQQTVTPGDAMSIYFYGDNITIYGKKVLDGGKVRVILDGEEIGTIDLYNNSTVNKEALLKCDDLVYGMHVAEIKLLTESNPSSQGKRLVIESALIQNAFIIEHSPYDIISRGDIIKQVNCVYQNIGENVKYFCKDADYQLVGKNRLKWISVNRPDPDYDYSVEYIRRASKANTYKSSNCPRCYGLGWYGAFNDLNTGLPGKSTGIYKIAEDVIKMLLTPLREDGYGSEFLEMNKALYVDATSVEDRAISEINRIERYYKGVQAEEIAKGATYTPEDTLYAIIIDKVSFNKETSTLTLEITVYNNVGQSHEATVNI